MKILNVIEHHLPAPTMHSFLSGLSPPSDYFRNSSFQQMRIGGVTNHAFHTTVDICGRYSYKSDSSPQVMFLTTYIISN